MRALLVMGPSLGCARVHKFHDAVSLAVLCCNAKCSLTLVLQKRLAAKLARIQVHRMRAESAVAAHTAVLQLVNIKAKANMFMSMLPTWRSDYVRGLLPAAGGSTPDLKATLVFHMGYHVLHRPGWDIQNLPLLRYSAKWLYLSQLKTGRNFQPADVQLLNPSSASWIEALDLECHSG